MSLPRIYQSIPFTVCIFFSIFSFAQNPVIKTTVDKNEILIGEQIKLNIEADFPADTYNIHWVDIADSIEHFEVLDRTKIDSIFSENKLTGLSQTFTITSFDSGQWNLPHFVIDFDSLSKGTTLRLLSDSLPITVSFSTADTSSQLRDIKPIREVPPASTFWYWVIGIVLVLLLIFLSIWLYKKYKNKKPSLPKKSALSAFEEAMNELEKLNQYQLSDAMQVKLFHSKLAIILKQYLSHIKNKNYLNKTTDEVLITLKGSEQVDHQSVANLAAALRCGDAVKFAKYLPAENVSADALTAVKKAIELLNIETTKNAV